MQRDGMIRAQRMLIRAMMRAAGADTFAALARKAGLSPSTITRLMDESRPTKYLLSSSSLAKLSAATGVAVPLAVAPEIPDHGVDLDRLRIAIQGAVGAVIAISPNVKIDPAQQAAISARIYAYLARHPRLRDQRAEAASEALAEEFLREIGRQQPKGRPEQD